MKTKSKIKLTSDEKAMVKNLIAMTRSSGECRSIYRCSDKQCKQIQSHDYVPYGIGRGRWYNICLCNAVDCNWIHRAIEIETLEPVYE